MSCNLAKSVANLVFAAIAVSGTVQAQTGTDRAGGTQNGAIEFGRELTRDFGDDKKSKPADIDAELAEIARTKALMKALSGADAPRERGTDKDASGSDLVSAKKLSNTAASNSNVQGGLLDPEMRAMMRDAAAEGAAGVKAAAAAIGVTTGNPAESARRAASSAPGDREFASGRAPKPGDDERLKQLIDGLIDEILPWVVALVLTVIIAFAAKIWFSSRIAANEKKRRSGSGKGQRSRSRPRDYESRN